MRIGFIAFGGVLSFILIKFSFLGALGVGHILQLSLICIIFSTIILGRKEGLIVAIVIGLIDELFSFRLVFGSFFVSYLFLVWWIDYLLNSFFTNRSGYSLVIVSAIGVLSFILFKFVFGILAYYAQLSDLSPVFNNQLVSILIYREMVIPGIVWGAYLIARKLRIVFNVEFLAQSKEFR